MRVVLRARLRLRLSVDNAHSDRLWEDADIFRSEVVLDGDTDEEDGLELSAGVNVCVYCLSLTGSGHDMRAPSRALTDKSARGTAASFEPRFLQLRVWI